MKSLNKTALSLLSLALIVPAFQVNAVTNQSWIEWAKSNASNAWDKTVELTGKAGSTIATTPSKAWEKTTDIYN